MIRDGENGKLVDFFDVDGLADRAADALAEDGDGVDNGIRGAARQTAVRRFDVNTVCLPAYLDLLRSLVPAGKSL